MHSKWKIEVVFYSVFALRISHMLEFSHALSLQTLKGITCCRRPQQNGDSALGKAQNAADDQWAGACCLQQCCVWQYNTPYIASHWLKQQPSAKPLLFHALRQKRLRSFQTHGGKAEWRHFSAGMQQVRSRLA